MKKDPEKLLLKAQKRAERARAARRLLIAMGIAAAAGFAVGILLAPQSGKETREALQKSYDELKNDHAFMLWKLRIEKMEDANASGTRT